MFVGFGRGFQLEGMSYNLEFDKIPLNFPFGREFTIWFFDMGNFFAFIPFGVIIPLLYRCTFVRFTLLFILSITVIETLQMITGLGAFDVNDITINTLGAMVGYVSQKVVVSNNDKLEGMVRILITSVVFSVITIMVVGSVNKYLDTPGPKIALHDFSNKAEEDLSPFVVNQEEISPEINKYVLSYTDAFTITSLDEDYKAMTGYVAIADGDFEGSITISFISEGIVIYEIGFMASKLDNEWMTFHIPLEGVNDLYISYSIDEEEETLTDVILWDMYLIESNRGQRALHNLNEFISKLFRNSE